MTLEHVVGMSNGGVDGRKGKSECVFFGRGGLFGRSGEEVSLLDQLLLHVQNRAPKTFEQRAVWFNSQLLELLFCSSTFDDDPQPE